MKKFLSLLTALSIIISCGTVAFAEDSAMAEALSVVKSRIPSTEQYDRLDSSKSVDYLGNTVYEFNWSTEDYEDRRELSVSVTGNGIITHYYLYEGKNTNEDAPSIKRKTFAEVKPVADAFLAKINPELYKNLEIKPESPYENLRAYGYDYNIQRVENGIPVYGDNGYIRVSADGKAVENFYMNFTEGLTFESAENLISAETAKKAYGEKLGLKLYYQTQVKNGKRTVIPVYAPAGKSNEYISAVNGEVITPIEPQRYGENGKFFNRAMGSVAEDSAESAREEGFTEAEKAELERMENLISTEKAEETARANTVLKLDESYKLQYSNLSKDYYDIQRYYITLGFRSDESYADVKIDATDGRIVNFYKSRSYTDKPEIKKEKAKDTAFSAIEILAPGLFPKDGKSVYIPDENTDDYGYYWTRHENGIPFPEGRAYVQVDKISGEVVSYNLVHENLEFPTLENVIAKNMALKRLFEQMDYEITYIKTCSEKGLSAYDKALAVYMPEYGNYAVMHAETGDLLSNPKQAELVLYGDVTGHFAENAAKTLLRYGVGFAGGKFLPDELITQRDLVVLLNCIFGNSSSVVIEKEMDYKVAYSNATRYGMLDPEEYSPESNVTREDAAIMIIRAMGLEEAAKLSDIYNCPFADVIENKGYVSILGAMGVFNGDSMGNFNPDAFITRGEAAVVLYNYLDR